MQAPSVAFGSEHSLVPPSLPMPPTGHPATPEPHGAPAPGATSTACAPRLTSKQLRAVSAQWRARAAAGDESANLVADALNWVAVQRAKQEPAAIKVLAGRISQWMGL